MVFSFGFRQFGFLADVAHKPCQTIMSWFLSIVCPKPAEDATLNICSGLYEPILLVEADIVFGLIGQI